MKTLTVELKLYFQNMKKMPLFLQYLFGLFLITSYPGILLAFWPWPGRTYNLNGVDISYTEFWLTGMAPSFLTFLLLMATICWGIIHGKLWSKWGVLLFWSSILFAIGYGSTVGISIASVFSGLLAYYLFKSKKVVNYYKAANSSA